MISGPALLFCPGDRPDRFAKALERADSLIIDLEDAVAPPDKPAARAALTHSALDPARVIVRVNPATSDEHSADLAALASTDYRSVMLPKAERPTDLAGLSGYRVIALCETPVGVRDVDALAADDRVAALTWGAEDLVAATGGFAARLDTGEFGELARYARARVLVAAAAAGKPAYDTVHPDLSDTVGLAREAEEAARAGFCGAMCLHPGQVATLREAYRPSPERIAWAERVVAAAAQAPGVFALDGQMIDEPLIRQARRIHELAAGGR